MKRRELRFAVETEEDLVRLYQFLLTVDLELAERALRQIRRGLLAAAEFPFSCRRTTRGAVRECVIPFGRAGHVAAFEIGVVTTASN
jgi:hypothetical protein